MKWLISGIGLLIIFIFQLSLADLGFLGSAPNLVLVYLCISLIYLKVSDVMWLGVGTGILLDFFSALPDGIMLAGLLGSLSLAYYFGQMFFTEKLTNFLPLFYVMFATIFFFLAIMLAHQGFIFFEAGRILDWNSLLTYKLGADAILNLLAIYPVFWYYNLQTKIQTKFVNKYEPI